MKFFPAAPATVASSGGVKRPCPDCGEEVCMTYGMMGSGEPLRCGRCYDDWYFRDSLPGVREAAERHLVDVLRWMLTGQTPVT